MTQGGVKHEKNPANIELTRQLKTVLESWLVWTIIPRSRCWAFLLLWDIWPTALLTRQQLFIHPPTTPPNWPLSCRRLCAWWTPPPCPSPSSSPSGKTLWYEGQRHRQIFEDCLPYHLPELPPDVLDDLSHHFWNVRTQKAFSGL